MTNPLRELEGAGQAVWLDYLHRKILENGELKRLIDEDGVKGLTSNPVDLREGDRRGRRLRRRASRRR